MEVVRKLRSVNNKEPLAERTEVVRKLHSLNNKEPLAER